MCYEDIICHARLLYFACQKLTNIYTHTNKWARIALMSPRMRASTGTPDTQTQSNLVAGPKQSYDSQTFDSHESRRFIPLIGLYKNYQQYLTRYVNVSLY